MTATKTVAIESFRTAREMLVTASGVIKTTGKSSVVSVINGEVSKHLDAAHDALSNTINRCSSAGKPTNREKSTEIARTCKTLNEALGCAQLDINGIELATVLVDETEEANKIMIAKLKDILGALYTQIDAVSAKLFVA